MQTLLLEPQEPVPVNEDYALNPNTKLFLVYGMFLHGRLLETNWSVGDATRCLRSARVVGSIIVNGHRRLPVSSRPKPAHKKTKRKPIGSWGQELAPIRFLLTLQEAAGHKSPGTEQAQVLEAAFCWGIGCRRGVPT